MPGTHTHTRTRPPAPSDAGRSAVRRLVTALPAEWAEIDALAARLARPGYRENVSETLRACVRAVLNAEALGLLAIEDGRIRPLPQGGDVSKNQRGPGSRPP